MSYERTWKCPECGFSIGWSYDELAQRGQPVCQKCDCDHDVMDLQPAGENNRFHQGNCLITAAAPVGSN